MLIAIHPTTYRSGGFLAHGVLNGNKILKIKSAYTLACLKAKMEKEDFGLSELEAISRKYKIVSISDTFSITEQCGKIALVQSAAGSKTFFYPAPDVILQKSHMCLSTACHTGYCSVLLLKKIVEI